MALYSVLLDPLVLGMAVAHLTLTAATVRVIRSRSPDDSIHWCTFLCESLRPMSHSSACDVVSTAGLLVGEPLGCRG